MHPLRSLRSASPSHASPSHASPSHASPSHASPSHASPSHASPSLREGEENGELCFSLDSRVRGNDGGRAPLPFAKRRGGVGGCILEVVLVDPNCAGRVFFCAA